METAMLDVRVFPWRPRARVMQPDTLRDVASGAGDLAIGEDLHVMVIGLTLWLVIIIAAPLVVLVLAAGLFSIELPIIVGLAVLLVVARFAGLIPWTVFIFDSVSGDVRRESFRSIWRATARIRGINADRHVKVRWAWT